MRTLLALAVTAVVPAGAQAANGITPISPARGATVAVGTRPTFRMRVHGAGLVWVRVCRSPKRHRDGTICDSANFGRAHRRHGSVFTYTPRLFRFEGFWLETPGTYYWQAYRLACTTMRKDCRREGAVTRFKIG